MWKKHFALTSILKVSKLMNKELAQNKVYNYFNTGDPKTLIKLKEK